jgi:hypothetical protein
VATIAGEAQGASPVALTWGRERLFAGLFLLSTLNAFTGHAVRSIEQRGVTGAAFELFGLSAILWVALAAGIAIPRESADSPLHDRDRPIAVLVALAALVPTAPASSVALTLLAGWGIATSPSRSTLRRASIIFLAMTGALLWGRLLLAVFSRPLLDIDAFFSALLLDAHHQGNMLWKDGTPLKLVVAPGCSSMQGISLALVFWATINQYFDVRFGWRAAGYALAAIAATIGINVLRIGAMLRWPDLLDAIHHGWGWHVAMWATLLSVVAICVHGARREIFGAA